MTRCPCKKFASFNIKGQKPLYCKTCKKDGMVNVNHKTCIDCDTRPSYNIRGLKTPIYCKDHKTDDMIDIIKHKTCIDCDIRPSYNIRGLKQGIYCKDHKTDGMVDVVNKTCLKCDKIPLYNTFGSKQGIYCKDHKTDDMVDVINPKCKTHLCDTFVSNKYEGYCLGCFMQMFPNKPIAMNYKTKERNIVDNIKRMFPDVDWVWDRKVSGGCSQRRPDLFLDMGTHIIIIEIDENKHDDYDCSCENKRVMELSQDVGHTPIVFIRFNPDKYTDSNGKNITSCWGLDGKNIMAIKKCKTKEWNDRMNVLNNQIQYWVDNPTDKTVETIQLFY